MSVPRHDGMARRLTLALLISAAAGLGGRVAVCAPILEYNLAAGKAVIDGSSAYNGQPFNQGGFAATKVTDGGAAGDPVTDVFSSNYWLASQGAGTGYFTLDLGSVYNVGELRIFNTHNATHNDRGTLDFSIQSATAVDGANQLISPQTLYNGTLAFYSGESPLTAQVFNEDNGLVIADARYLRFNVLSSVNSNPGLNEIRVFRTNQVLNSVATGNWADGATWDGSGTTPGAAFEVFVHGHTVTVPGAGAASVVRLDDAAGELGIGPAGSLAVGLAMEVSAGALDVQGSLSSGSLHAAPGSTVSLGADASLSTGSGSVASLSTHGGSTLAITAGELPVQAFSDSGVAGTLVKQGAGSLTLDNRTGSTVSASSTALRIEGGRVSSSGADPLGGMTAVTLAGGTLALNGPAILPAVAGLSLHLDASALGLAEGTPVDSWTDLAAGNHATQADASRQPKLRLGGINGMPVVRFDGDDYLATAGSFGTQYTVFAVENMPTVEGTQSQRLVTSQDNNWLMGYWQGMEDVAHPGGWIANPGPAADGQPDLHAITADNTNSKAFYADGVYMGGGTAGDATAIGRLELGGWKGTGEMSKGDVAEILLYDHALTAGELDQVGSYLTAKYALTTAYTGAGLAALDMTGTSLAVEADSTLETHSGGTRFGPLTLSGGILTVSGAPISFAATTVTPGAGTVGFDADADVSPGALGAAGAAVTLVKDGEADLVLDQPGTGLGNAVLDVRGGRVVGLAGDAVAGALLRLDGGNVLLSSLSGDRLYPNSLELAQSGGLAAGTAAGGADGPLTVSLGGAADTVHVPAPAVLDVQTSDGYTLDVRAALAGDGTVTVSGNQTRAGFSGGGSIGEFRVESGQAATAGLTVEQRMLLGDNLYTVTGGSLRVSGADLLAARQVSLNGGTLTIRVPQPPPTDGLQAYWSFNNNAAPGDDNSGNLHALSLLNGAAWTADGRLGGALSLSGDNDYADAVLNVSETAYGVSMWFKADTGMGGLFSVTGGGHDRHLYLYGDEARSRVWSEETIATSGLTLLDGNWHHIVHTFGGTEGGQKIYVDGELRASGSKAWSDFTTQTNVHVGQSNDRGYFDGLIDDVRVYERALDAGDVLSLYSPGSGIFTTVTTDTVVEAATQLVLETADPIAFGDLAIRAGATLDIASGPVQITFDELTVTFDGPPLAGDYTLMTYDAGALSPFSALNVSLPSNWIATFNDYTVEGRLVLTLTETLIPEPSTALLLLAALASRPLRRR